MVTAGKAKDKDAPKNAKNASTGNTGNNTGDDRTRDSGGNGGNTGGDTVAFRCWSYRFLTWLVRGGGGGF